jgi:hypothetical protein
MSISLYTPSGGMFWWICIRNEPKFIFLYRSLIRKDDTEKLFSGEREYSKPLLKASSNLEGYKEI